MLKNLNSGLLQRAVARWLRRPQALPALAAIACAWALAACNSDTCEENQSSLPVVNFYTSGTTQLRSLPLLTVYGIGAPGDSLLIDSTATASMTIPLRMSATTTQYVLAYNDSVHANDTLTFNYQPVPYFVSKECGAMYMFSIQSCTATYNYIDSISLLHDYITNDGSTSLRVFFPAGSTSLQ